MKQFWNLVIAVMLKLTAHKVYAEVPLFLGGLGYSVYEKGLQG